MYNPLNMCSLIVLSSKTLGSNSIYDYFLFFLLFLFFIYCSGNIIFD